MSLYRLRQEFEDIIRVARLDEMNPLKDRWINWGWEKITEQFIIPALTKTINIPSVSNQQLYLFPYNYNGTEIGLKYSNRRMDPVLDETLRLKYEKRTGNMGAVRYYDWSGTAETDLIVLADCTLTNKSKLVLTTSTDPALVGDYWVRADPYQEADPTVVGRDYNGYMDPGDYGYQIDPTTFVPGVSFQLKTLYRGPTGAHFTLRVRPAEQQQFIMYGVPSSSDPLGFELRYSSRPARLYNDEDVPEWPNMEEAVAYMAASVALDWHHNTELSKVFWSRAVQRISNLEKRRMHSQTLVSDLTIGSVVGRQTGLLGIYGARGYRSGIGRYR